MKKNTFFWKVYIKIVIFTFSVFFISIGSVLLFKSIFYNNVTSIKHVTQIFYELPTELKLAQSIEDISFLKYQEARGFGIRIETDTARIYRSELVFVRQQAIVITLLDEENITTRKFLIFDESGYIYTVIITDFNSGYRQYQQFFEEYGIATLSFITLFSAIVGAGFAIFLKRKVLYLSEVTMQMKKLEVESVVSYEGEDVFYLLEKNIYDMYWTIKDANDKISEENKYIKTLETDNRLFMQTVSHELKTPIMALNIILEGIIEGMDEYADTFSYIVKGHKILTNMKQLVSELLVLSKLERVYAGTADIVDILQEFQKMYEYIYGDKIHITMYKTSQVIPFPDKIIAKIISNLLSNAAKYKRPTTDVFVHVTEKQIVFRNEYVGVVDTNKIFLPFYSTDDDEQMSQGIGLFVVKVLLDKYKIKWQCTTTDNQFIFTIFLA